MTDAELESIVARISGALSFAREQAGLPPQSPRPWAACAKDAERVEAARGRLVAAGSSDTVVKAFSALQVILLDEKRDYEIERDERGKLLALPRWQIDSCRPSSGKNNIATGCSPISCPGSTSSAALASSSSGRSPCFDKSRRCALCRCARR